MIRRLLIVAAVSALSACGVDGEPIQPSVGASVGIGTGGVYSNVGVGVSKGPLSVFLGL